jgi:hypothetical protein
MPREKSEHSFARSFWVGFQAFIGCFVASMTRYEASPSRLAGRAARSQRRR